jgi:anti-sigma factor RsiW
MQLTNPITRDVINDLLPVYFSGEASADSRQLVESYLANHPDFAAQVKADWNDSLGALQNVPFTLRPGAELEALGWTKKMLRTKTFLLILALLFTLLPLAFPGQWAAAAVCWVCAAGGWVGVVMMRRMLRVTGL